MAFNSRKFQKLMDEEKNNAAGFVDEFEDDFADDFADDNNPLETGEPDSMNEFVQIPESDVDIEPAAVCEPVEEEPAEQAAEEVAEEPAEEPEAAAEVVEEVQPEAAEEPAAEPAVIAAEETIYDSRAMWQDMASLAIKAKECITAGAYFRANDIVTAMRSMLVEMMCRTNGITENFNENADNLNDSCKQDIYTSYPATLNAQALSDVVTHIMAVTYKYI